MSLFSMTTLLLVNVCVALCKCYLLLENMIILREIFLIAPAFECCVAVVDSAFRNVRTLHKVQTHTLK